MKPASIKDQTTNFNKPRDWNDERDGPCGVLEVRVVKEGRYSCHYSNWKPDAAELAALEAGGVVELCCVGVQPPVSVGVVPEHKEDE